MFNKKINRNIFFLRSKRIFAALTILNLVCSNYLGLKANALENIENNNKIIDVNYLKKLPINDYIIDSGDRLNIIISEEFTELNRLSVVDGEGTIFLPRLNRVFVKGLTTNELTKMLNKSYEEYIKIPSLEITIETYRPIKLVIQGEIMRPGSIILPGSLSLKDKKTSTDENLLNNLDIRKNNSDTYTDYFPTVFDAIRQAGGITQNSDLSNVTVIRKNNKSNGGGFIQTKLDFEKDLKTGYLSKNIRIYDSDVIKVGKLDKPLDEKSFFNASNNLNPDFINVFVNGKVVSPGKQVIAINSSLNEAIYMAGGMDGFNGPIKFIRFNIDGSINKRTINFKHSSKRGSFNNPYLRESDLILVGKSKFNIASEVISDVTSPFVGIFSTYSLIKAISE